MHQQTKDSLQRIADETCNVIRADDFLLKLEALLPTLDPDRGKDDSYHTLQGRTGFLTIQIFNASEGNDVRPFLRAARESGFKRFGEVEKFVTSNQLAWTYYSNIGSLDNVSLNIILRFKETDSASAVCGFITVGQKSVDDVQLLCGEEFLEARAALAVQS